MNQLIIMAKRPVIGAVKTRLGRDIGSVKATAFYRHMLARTINDLGCDPRWQTLLAVAPDRAIGDRLFPGNLAQICQGGGDIGERMARLLSRNSFGCTLVIGSDIAGLSRQHIAAPFAQLRHKPFVFGPARDGGFWLVGCRSGLWRDQVFDDVRWSSEHTLADVLVNLDDEQYALAATLSDVDTGADYRKL